MSGIFWLMVFCNVIVPQIFWFKKARTNIASMWVASLFINVGMWCERFNIVVTSLHQDFLPSSWENYAPTWVDITPVHRDHRPVLDAVPAVPQVRTGGRGDRGQGAAPRAGA
jgi:hypothetical protein